MWGNWNDKCEFGLLYPLFYGSEEGHNYKMAVKAITRLAESSYVPAIYTLGCAYNDGKGIRKNLGEAFACYLKAANENYPSAEGAVANFYIIAKPRHNACEYSPDKAVSEYCPDKAVWWYKRAANNGNCGSQYNLAQCYFTGNGVDKSYPEAYIWASMAVHCSPIRFIPAEVTRDKALALLNDDERKKSDESISELKEHLTYIWSEHLMYWRKLYEEASV